jgi:hypothetical protein
MSSLIFLQLINFYSNFEIYVILQALQLILAQVLNPKKHTMILSL